MGSIGVAAGCCTFRPTMAAHYVHNNHDDLQPHQLWSSHTGGLPEMYLGMGGLPVMYLGSYE